MFLILICLFILLFYFYGTRNHNYWKKKGVHYENPMFLFGTGLEPIINSVSLSEYFANIYRCYPNEKYVGTYHMRTPSLLIRDPELIKNVVAVDFKHFHYRNMVKNTEETLFKNLFHADGDTWKLMRQKLTPAFSSGKLKAMFPLIVERTDKLLKIADEIIETNDEVDIRDLMARYTTDFIGVCGFGLDLDTLNEKDSNFRKLGRRIFTATKRDVTIAILKEVFPEVMKPVHFMVPEIERQTTSLVKQIMTQRNYKPSGRNDFIDIMLELREKKKIYGESIEKFNPDGTPVMTELEITDALLTAQVFIFFAAGFETSSHASSFLLHLLAYHPDEQVRCQKEVDHVLEKYEGKLCYDAVKEMKYLEMAFS